MHNIDHLQPTVSRRDALRFLAVGGAGVLLAACGGQAAPSSAPASTPASSAAPAKPSAASAAPASSVAAAVSAKPSAASAPASAQPKTGGTLNWGRLGNLVTLDGHNFSNTDGLFHIWDRLIVLDEKLNMVPRLAESWDINADFTQIKLNIRKGVQFHTGRELTSDDVVWNFNRVKDPSVGGGIFASYVAPLQSVTNPDKYTVLITAKAPYPYISHILEAMNILDPVTMQGPDAATKPVGTGPFMFKEYAQGDHLTMAKNANYWRTGLPYVDTLQMKIFTDPQAQVTNLEAGSIDAAVNIAVRDAARLQNDPKYSLVLNQNSGAAYVMTPNASLPPTNSKELRQAINYAIDRQRIADTVLLKLGNPINMIWYPTSPLYDAAKDKTYTFDLDKAKALVQKSGVANPTFDFNYSTASPETAQMAQIIQGDLAKAGVTVNLKGLEPAALAGIQYTAKYNGVAFGTALFGQVQPGVQFGSPYYGPLNNWSGFKDDQLTKLASDMATATDPAKQKQAGAAYTDYVLDQSFTIAICSLLPRVVTTAKVHGVAYDMAYILNATEAWIG